MAASITSTIFDPEVEFEGSLSKLGGGGGGHKCVVSRRGLLALRCAPSPLSPLPSPPPTSRRNWKDRYFVLSDHLYYSDSKTAYDQDPNDALGRINLVAYNVSRTDPDTNEFCVHAYPKVRPLSRERPPAQPLIPLPPPLCAPSRRLPAHLLALPLTRPLSAPVAHLPRGVKGGVGGVG